MKKRFNLIIVIMVLVLIITTILLMHFTRNNNLSFVIFPKHYSLLYDEYPEFEISVYTNNDNCKYMDSNHIESSVLYNNEESYNVLVTNKEETTKTKINDKVYYEQKLLIKLEFNSTEKININNANMLLTFNTGESLNFKVGNICFYQNKSDNHLKIHKVQAIVNDFGLYDSLAAVMLSISAEGNCIINNVLPISTSIGINNDFIHYDTELTYEHSAPLKEILNQEYDFFKPSTKSFNALNLNKNSKKDVIIPLYYMQNEYVDSLGLLIEYTIDGNQYTQIINPYKLYQSHRITYFLNEYKLSKN